MKADTFAKLVVLDALVEAEVGYYLQEHPSSFELFREGMVSRISDLVDEVDILDSVAAARVYDSIVDFLSEMSEQDADGVVEAMVRFRRAVDRTIMRGMDRSELSEASTWAIVADELLGELADEYHMAVVGSEVRRREMMRAESLLARARQAAERMLWNAEVVRPEMMTEFDRLIAAVRHRRLRPTDVDYMILSLQRRAARYRPSTLTRVGTFVIKQVLRRADRGKVPSSDGSKAGEERTASPEPSDVA